MTVLEMKPGDPPLQHPALAIVRDRDIRDGTRTASQRTMIGAARPLGSA